MRSSSSVSSSIVDWLNNLVCPRDGKRHSLRVIFHPLVVGDAASSQVVNVVMGAALRHRWMITPITGA